MLLLDNFVHSDLHPGNIMIKFYKPSTHFILKSMLSELLGTQKPTDPTHSSSTEEAEEMDSVDEEAEIDGYVPGALEVDVFDLKGSNGRVCEFWTEHLRIQSVRNEPDDAWASSQLRSSMAHLFSAFRTLHTP